MQKQISQKMLQDYRSYLLQEEKSEATIEKYMRDVRSFAQYSSGQVITKELVLEYKRRMISAYAARSVNSKLASLTSFFRFLGWQECQVKALRLQKQAFQPEERELTKGEYFRLLQAAKRSPRLYLLLETICATGIRVSELQYFTVEAISVGTITVRCKGKTRNIFIPGKLRKRLLAFARQKKITEGVLFRTRSGNPMNRSNIWAQMKSLCASAQVNPKKVFPHNLRKLFARTFYAMEKDIAKLADILGHSSINTTRIYIMTTGAEHRRQLERMGLVV